MARVARIAFPVGLLLMAGLFFGGHLGWWSDDSWHNLRDPVTDRVSGLVMHRGFFLRPLFYRVVPPVTTLFWHQDWAAHAIQIGSHALVVVLLWRLMLMLGIGRRAAGAAALLFMVYPAQFEALFWVAALPTSMSAALMLGVMMLSVRVARGGGWWLVGVMAGMTFAACCLNEQPASVAAVLPVAAWAGRSGTQRSRRKAEEWSRILAPGFLCVLAAGLYIVLLRLGLKDAPAGVRGGAGSFVTLDQVGARAVYFCDVLWRRLVMKNWGLGALQEGWRQLGAWGLGAFLVVGALGVWWGMGRAKDERMDAPDPSGGWRIAVLGAGVFLVGWLPIAAMAAYEPDSRCRYWPDIGLAVVVGAVIGAVGRKQQSSKAAEQRVGKELPTTVARLGLVGVLLVWAVMLVGVQAGFRNRWELDQAEFSELRRLVPSPAPLTMLVPLEVKERGLETGSPVLDTHFRSVWEFPWTTIRAAERIYRRDDLRCGYWRHWTPRVPVRGADAKGIHYDDTLGPAFPALPDGTRLIPWERALPFVIGADHRLRVVTHFVLERAGRADEVVEVPQARGLARCEWRLPGL